MTDDLSTRIAAVLYRLWRHRFPRSSPWEQLAADERESWLTDADAVIRELDGYSATSTWRTAMNETRPDYILAIRAQALDEVQELIAPDDAEDSDWIAIWNTRPKLDVWRKIVEAAFPPPPIAGGFSADA